MLCLAKIFEFPVGYSDHTLGIQVPVMAATLGARVIEKHFTLDKTFTGPDHKASLEPDELQEMIKQIRNIDTILGSEKKAPNKSELSMIKTIRKSIVTLGPIEKGEKLTSQNIGIKRPGTGLLPKYYAKLLGKKAKHSFETGEVLSKKDL